MANIRIDLGYPIINGSEAIFIAPCDCSDIEGLAIYHPETNHVNAPKIATKFIFKDAHGNDLSDMDNLFKSGAYVKVLLNVTAGHAYIQNADTNKYLESKFVAANRYADQAIANVTATGIPKLLIYPMQCVATTDGQTTFDIDLETFDTTTDTVLVQSGVTMLFPNADFTVSNKKVTLLEGVPVGRTIGIYVFKNMPAGEDGSVSGAAIIPNSLDLDRLKEMPVTRKGMLTGTLLSSGWSDSTPYTQKIEVSGIKDGDKPIIGKGTPTSATASNFKALNKAWGMVDDHSIEDGYITFYCYNKKPTVNIPLLIKI